MSLVLAFARQEEHAKKSSKKPVKIFGKKRSKKVTSTLEYFQKKIQKVELHLCTGNFS